MGPGATPEAPHQLPGVLRVSDPHRVDFLRPTRLHIDTCHHPVVGTAVGGRIFLPIPAAPHPSPGGEVPICDPLIFEHRQSPRLSPGRGTSTFRGTTRISLHRRGETRPHLFGEVQGAIRPRKESVGGAYRAFQRGGLATFEARAPDAVVEREPRGCAAVAQDVPLRHAGSDTLPSLSTSDPPSRRYASSLR